MALGRFQYEPISSDVNKVCFEGEQAIPTMREKSRKKVKTLLNAVDVGNKV